MLDSGAANASAAQIGLWTEDAAAGELSEAGWVYYRSKDLDDDPDFTMPVDLSTDLSGLHS